MKLITHNMLTSNIIKGVKKGFPLGIAVSRIVRFICNTAYYRSCTCDMTYQSIGHTIDLAVM